MDITYLFVPGDRPDRFAKALASGADRVILDLEDAVRPEARAAARIAIREADLEWSRVVVRMNDAASPHHADDLALLSGLPAAGVLVAKTERIETLAAVAAAMPEAEILPQIETVVGLYALPDLLTAPGVRRAAFGHLDFALDLGAAPDWDVLLHARSMLVMSSRLAEAEPPIDSVMPDIRDMDRLRREATYARQMGFGGKLLIHPAQVAPVAEAFAPSADDIAWAERVLAALAESDSGAVALDGKMIDKPVEDAAHRILARVRR